MHAACVSTFLHDEEICLLRIAPIQWQRAPVKSNNAWDCDSWSIYLNAYLTDAVFEDHDVRRRTVMDTRDKADRLIWSLDLPIETGRDEVAIVAWMKWNRRDEVNMTEETQAFGSTQMP